MRAVNRWLVALIWMLSLALPLQGLAAALPMAAAGSIQMPAEVAPAPQAHPCHAASSASPVLQDAQTGCAACAACHASTAPAPGLPTLLGPDMRAAGLPDWCAPAEPSVLPEGLDRPPRHPLA
jgi:cytochrome c553